MRIQRLFGLMALSLALTTGEACKNKKEDTNNP